MDVSSMKVVELRSYLKSRGALTTGNKDTLLKRAVELSKTDIKVERDENKETDKVNEAGGAVAVAADADNLVAEKENFQELESKDELMRQVLPCESQIKRKMSESPSFPRPKRTKGISLPKNPIMILNEIKPGLKYEMVSSGDPHLPNFIMEVEFHGQKYQGNGRTKKMAKHNAAANALRSTVQFEDPDKLVPYMLPINQKAIDFTSDTMEDLAKVSIPIFDMEPQNMAVEYSVDGSSAVSKSASTHAVKNPNITPDKNPVMLLNEMVPGLLYECVDETGFYQAKVFTMQVKVNGNVYQGYGKNKKLGKVGAAIKALRKEFSITLLSPHQEAVPSNVGHKPGDSSLPYAENLAELVHKLIHEKFSSMTENATSEHAKHKVLAGIVMTKGADYNEYKDAEVVSLATGTKCINGEYISDQGTALFDCHAEIVSRRGLRRFLYQQLLSEARGEVSVFERIIDGGFRVKPDICFHLYINTSPCGDSRIFSPHETTGEHDDNHPNRKSRGLLRTKIENGEGTIPVENGIHVQERNRGNVQQTWDAIISGERLLTMSCSDKLAKWNVLGVQGSLLSLYMEPIYLSSILLGSLYHSTHIERGVYSRANDAIQAAISGGNTAAVPIPFKVHRPLLAAVPNPQKRVAKKAPTFCLHWTIGDNQPQIINTTTGRTSDGDPSNLCKLAQMKQFIQVASCDHISGRFVVHDPAKLTYAQLKNAAVDYQNTKYLLMTGFHKTECGSWVGKPAEVDSFTCID